MRITGMGIGFIDVAAEDAETYNRWWDLTMGPENAALEELVAARRYIATPECQSLRGPIEEKGFEAGRATYCHMYMFSTADVAAGQASMGALARRLNDEGRNFGKGWARYQGPHRLVSACARSDLRLSPDAIPFVNHVAIQISIGVVEDMAFSAEVDSWYDQIHLPDIVETPGFLAALRLLPVSPEKQGRFINIFLLDETPAKALAAFRQRVPGLRDRGRLSSPGKSVRLLFGGPYQPLVPLQYDFLKSNHSSGNSDV